MRKIQTLAVLAFAVVLAGVARAEGYTKPAAITVVAVQGEARYSIDGRTWHPLVVGKILRSGAVIETAAGSSADLIVSGNAVPFPEDTSAPQNLSMLSIAPDPNIRGYMAYKPMAQQNVIRLSADTMLAVDKLTTVDTGVDTVGDTELDLRAGKVFVSAKKLSADSQYIIKLPNGVAGIRGAAGSITDKGVVEALSGIWVVSLIGADGQPHVVTVHGGFQYDPATGEISHLSSQILGVLEAFGYDASTLYRQTVLIPQDLSLCFISRTGKGHNLGKGNPSEP